MSKTAVCVHFYLFYLFYGFMVQQNYIYKLNQGSVSNLCSQPKTAVCSYIILRTCLKDLTLFKYCLHMFGCRIYKFGKFLIN